RRHTRFSRDWSSDVCSSDLKFGIDTRKVAAVPPAGKGTAFPFLHSCHHIIGRITVDEPVRGDQVYDVLLTQAPVQFAVVRARPRSEERRVGKGCSRRWATGP